MPVSSGDGKCPRCLQPARPGAAHCPHCGHRLPGDPRRLLLLLGGVGVLLLALMIGLALFPPPDEGTEGQDQQQQSQPAEPEKKPPLN